MSNRIYKRRRRIKNRRLDFAIERFIEDLHFHSDICACSNASRLFQQVTNFRMSYAILLYYLCYKNNIFIVEIEYIDLIFFMNKDEKKAKRNVNYVAK